MAHRSTREALLEERHDVERMLSRGEIDPVLAKLRRVLLSQALGEDVRLTIVERPDFKKLQAGDREDA